MRIKSPFLLTTSDDHFYSTLGAARAPTLLKKLSVNQMRMYYLCAA